MPRFSDPYMSSSEEIPSRGALLGKFSHDTLVIVKGFVWEVTPACRRLPRAAGAWDSPGLKLVAT